MADTYEARVMTDMGWVYPVKVRIGPRNPNERLDWQSFDYQGHGELHSTRCSPKGPDPRPLARRNTVTLSGSDRGGKYRRGIQEW